MGEDVLAAYITALVSAAVAITIGVMSYFHNRATLREKKISDKKNGITQKLNEFYGPLLAYLNVTKALFKIFSRNKPDGFRTLPYLLDPEQEYEINGARAKVVLTEADKKLLEDIIEVEERIEELIIDKGGLVDDSVLTFEYIPDPEITDVKIEGLSLLGIAITHFRVLRMAYHGRFNGEDVDKFKNFVYPRELDYQLRRKIEALHEELEELSI